MRDRTLFLSGGTGLLSERPRSGPFVHRSIVVEDFRSRGTRRGSLWMIPSAASHGRIWVLLLTLASLGFRGEPVHAQETPAPPAGRASPRCAAPTVDPATVPPLPPDDGTTATNPSLLARPIDAGSWDEPSARPF